MRLQRILVPIDFSGTADRAVEVALELAEAVGGQLTLLYVYGAPATMLPDGSTFAASPRDLVEASSRADQALADVRRTLETRAATAGVKVAAETRMGMAADEIVHAAESGAFDLVVMGTHGRTGLGRLLMGSVAESVMRHARIPVLTVREGPRVAQEVAVRAAMHP
jgi:nucleotide-binding universal stress UspA family protein